MIQALSILDKSIVAVSGVVQVLRFNKAAISIVGSGKMACQKFMDDASTLKAMRTRVNGLLARQMDRGLSTIKMARSTTAIGLTTNVTAMVSSDGPTRRFTKGISRTEGCMGRASSFGTMARSIVDSLSMERRRAMGFGVRLGRRRILEYGKMICSMELGRWSGRMG
jgi:hypothetical protein